MENFYPILQKVVLFEGLDRKELSSILECLQAQRRSYKKGSIILSAGSKPQYVGIVLSGKLHVVKDDRGGSRSILATLAESDIFAEALCCAKVAKSPVSVLCNTDADILLVEFSRILNTCSNACMFHQKLIANMLKIIAQKNLYLQGRMELIQTKSIRDKVLMYLGGFVEKQDSCFTIPHNRQEMADYLNVERSALSHELMRMKKEGLIEYRKDRFILF